jgi:putative hydrolase of the HAD superfamily
MRFKALLVDLDGVVRRWPASDELIEDAHGLPRGVIRRIAFAPDLLSLAITGQITDQEWRQRVADRLQLEFSLGSVSIDVVKKWSQIIGEVDWETVSILRQCDASIRRGLVTNATSRLEGDLARLRIADEFDFVVNSSEVGIAKPDRKIFEISLLRAGIEPAEALFIDDIAENVMAAEDFGITGHVFSDHAELLAFLRQLGVIPPDNL